MRIHYPSPAMLERALAPCFEAARCSALGFILPPGYAAGWLERSPRLLSALSVLEHAASRFAAGLADHYILEARRA
jgi:hypothetical protein